MKSVSKNQTKTVRNGVACTVTEYALGHELMDMALATISGRYPETKRVANQQCDELAHVLEGDGNIVVEGKIYPLSAGDTIIIEAGEKYYWEGQMKLVLSCRPAWHLAQHVSVE